MFGAILGNYACTCGDTWASELGVLSKTTPRLITTMRPVQRGPSTFHFDPSQKARHGGCLGTNGGVTLLGLSASLGGGLFVGLACYLGTLLSLIGQPIAPVIPSCRTPDVNSAGLQAAISQWPVIALGLVGGLVGSIVDSLLGATLQFSGYDMKQKKVVNRPGDNPDNVYKINGVDLLSNNQVNLLSSLVTALALGFATQSIFIS